MIDEQITMQLYGYTSDELGGGSHKPVVAVCEECGEYRVVENRRYRDLCLLCKRRTKEYREKIGRSKMGNKYNKGMRWSKETRCKMSEAARNRPPISDDTRRKMSKARTGHIFSSESCKKISISKLGSANPSWKGGVTPVMKRVRQSPAYRNWRKAVFERDDYTCQICDERGGDLEAHHIEPVRNHKNDLLVYDIDNGITLCKDCHNKTKGREIEFIEQFESMIINRSY